MELRQLAYFLAVADHGSFSAAADELPVTQPALSLSVRRLERELGTELFLRLGRQVALTPAGTALAGPARQALWDAEAARSAVARVRGLETGRLSLASLPTLAPDPLGSLVGTFCAHHPGVRVELAAPEDSEDLVALLTGGRCELAVGEALGQGHLPGLVEHPLGRQRLVVLLPPGEEPPEGPYLLDRLAGRSVVATPPGTSSRRLLDEALAEANVTASVAVVTAQRDAVVPLVAAGAGAALVPEALAPWAGALGAAVADPDPPVTRVTVLLHRLGPLTPAAERFERLALEGSSEEQGRGQPTPLGPKGPVDSGGAGPTRPAPLESS